MKMIIYYLILSCTLMLCTHLPEQYSTQLSISANLLVSPTHSWNGNFKKKEANFKDKNKIPVTQMVG